MGTVRRLKQAAGRRWRQARQRYAWVDHTARAGQRYQRVRGDRLAAALAYYAFFAVFALSGVAFAVLGWIMRGDLAAIQLAQRWIDQNLPGVDVAELVSASGRIGVIALAALLVAGWYWVDGLRAAVRAVWRLEERPGRFLVRLGVDLAVVLALGLLLLLSVGTAVGVSAGVRWLVLDAAGADGGPVRWLISALGFGLGMAVNTVLAMALLTAVPRLKMPVRRVLGPALLVAIGLELLKLVGRLYFERTQANPAYHAVAGAVGLLLFLYLLNQAVLFAAALTATSQRGEAVDLAAGAPAPAVA